MKNSILLIFFFLAGASAPVLRAQAPNTNLSNIGSFDGEPFIAVNPSNTSNLIAGWMRLRVDGKIWIAVRSSFDGGASWSPIQFLPHMGEGYGSADVSIAFHQSGTAFLLYIDFRISPDTVGSLYLTNSTDGGLNWSTPVEAISAAGKADLPIDRPWIAVDNSGGALDGTVYVCSMSAYWHTAEHHIYLRSTSDKGATWSPVQRVDDAAFSPGAIARSYGAISVGGDGLLYMAFLSYDTTASPFVRMYAVTSSDAGNTWQRSVVTNVALSPTDVGYARGYSIAADPVRPGHAVVCWIDERYGDGDVLMKETTDGGRTWESVVRINDDPAGNGVVQDLVWAQYSSDGQLAIAWRDRRLSVPGVSAPFDIYARVSRDGGRSFDPNQRLSSASSPWITLGCCNSFLGVALSGASLFSVWSDFRSNDWEVYFHSSSIAAAAETANRSALRSIALEPNHPNPFSDGTVIAYSLPTSGFVTLKVHDALGRLVATLVDGWMDAGRHQFWFDAPDAPDGVYVCILQSGFSSDTRKMLLMQSGSTR